MFQQQTFINFLLSTVVVSGTESIGSGLPTGSGSGYQVEGQLGLFKLTATFKEQTNILKVGKVRGEKKQPSSGLTLMFCCCSGVLAKNRRKS